MNYKYPEKVHLHVTIDKDQFDYITKLVEKRRSTYSQVVREILQEIIKEEKRG